MKIRTIPNNLGEAGSRARRHVVADDEQRRKVGAGLRTEGRKRHRLEHRQRAAEPILVLDADAEPRDDEMGKDGFSHISGILNKRINQLMRLLHLLERLGARFFHWLLAAISRNSSTENAPMQPDCCRPQSAIVVMVTHRHRHCANANTHSSIFRYSITPRSTAQTNFSSGKHVIIDTNAAPFRYPLVDRLEHRVQPAGR